MKKLIPIILLSLTACHSIGSGNVVDKEIDPAYVSVMYMPVSNGKTTYIMPIPVYYPESYSVKLKGLDKKGNIKTETFYIAKDVFDTVKMGSYQCFDNGCTERPYEER